MYRMSETERTETGNNALKYYKENFDRNLLLDQLETLFAQELERT